MSWFRRVVNSSFANAKSFNERTNMTLDALHKVGVNVLLLATAYASYTAGRAWYHNRGFKDVWSGLNPYYEFDPYFMYNLDYMKRHKMSDEQIALSRPRFAAARAIREKYRIPMQPPFEPVALEVAVNGETGAIKEGPDANMVEFMTREQRAVFEAKRAAKAKAEAEQAAVAAAVKAAGAGSKPA